MHTFDIIGSVRRDWGILNVGMDRNWYWLRQYNMRLICQYVVRLWINTIVCMWIVITTIESSIPRIDSIKTSKMIFESDSNK
jgi:hypothetical protein